jgi:hypothetical protein
MGIILKECYYVDQAAEWIASWEYENCTYLERQSKRDELHKLMRRDANDGKLPGYDPKKKTAIRASWYDMDIFVTPQAVDAWLDEHVPEIKSRFSAHAFKGYILEVRPTQVDPALKESPRDTMVNYYEYLGGTVTGERRGEQTARQLVNYVEDKISRHKKGYFTVAEIAQIVARDRFIDEKDFIKRMLNAHVRGALIIRDSESHLRLEPNEKVNELGSSVKIADFDAWQEQEDVDYRFPPAAPAESKPENDAPPRLGEEKKSTTNRGLDRDGVLAHPWPLSNPNFTNESLANALSDVRDWLVPARLVPGRPGKNGSALWSPVLIAVALIGKNYARQNAIDGFIAANFPDWREDWNQSKESL